MLSFFQNYMYFQIKHNVYARLSLLAQGELLWLVNVPRLLSVVWHQQFALNVNSYTWANFDRNVHMVDQTCCVFLLETLTPTFPSITIPKSG